MRKHARLSRSVASAFCLLVASAHAASAQSPPPAAKPPPIPAPAPDKIAPLLTRTELSPKVAAAKTGTRLMFTLNEAARVAGTVTLRRVGVRTAGGRCIQRTSKRRGPTCLLRTKAGTVLAANAATGVNVALLDLRALRAGDYTLTLTPTDTAGNKGNVRVLPFRVKT